MTVTPVDETTAALVIGALQTARTRCISPVAALDRAGLLMTEHSACMVRHDVLINTAETVRNTRMRALHQARLMPRDATPAQVAKAIADRIEILAAQAKRGEYR